MALSRENAMNKHLIEIENLSCDMDFPVYTLYNHIKSQV